MVYIVAANQREFIRYCIQRGLSKAEAIHIRRPEQFQGLHEVKDMHVVWSENMVNNEELVKAYRDYLERP